MNYLIQSVALNTLAGRNDEVSVALAGKKVTERKESALAQADAVSMRAISHGSGSVAKQARAMVAEIDCESIAQNIASGNYHAFAVTFAARTGEDVKFGKKDASGKVVRKASDDFRAFGAVLSHRLTQLEAKDKVYTSKGGYTSAAADLMYLIALHERAVVILDEKVAADRERVARLMAERAAEVQAEKGAEVVDA